jgi:hypothetical protein
MSYLGNDGIDILDNNKETLGDEGTYLWLTRLIIYLAISAGI